MPKHFKVQREITGFSIESAPATVGGFKLEGAKVHNNWAAASSDPLVRICICDVVVRRCQLWSSWPTGILFRNIVVEDTRGAGVPVLLSACHFDRVVLSGWIGGFIFKWRHGFDKDVNQAFLEDNLRRYSTVEQAMDISQAHWRTFDALIGVPAKLVKRNPDEHFILRREHAQSIAARDDVGAWRIVASDLLASGLADTVVAPGESPSGNSGAQRLRAEGLIE
jgi:hypothetical protein